jgi:hypothetical protein
MPARLLQAVRGGVRGGAHSRCRHRAPVPAHRPGRLPARLQVRPLSPFFLCDRLTAYTKRYIRPGTTLGTSVINVWR